MHGRRSLSCFKTVKFSLVDEPKEDRSKRPDTDDRKAAVTENPVTPTWEISEKFNVCIRQLYMN